MTDLVEQAAQAIRASEGFMNPWPSEKNRRDAEAVLVVVAPVLRAEGAAEERERIKAGIEAYEPADNFLAVRDGHERMFTQATVLALVSREAEASDG